MPRSELFLRIAIIVTLSTICIVIADGQEEPQPDIREYTWDVGEVEADSVHDHVFDIKNPFEAAFGIHTVKKSCQSCTTVDYEKKAYLPGELIRVSMTVNTEKVNPGGFEAFAILMGDAAGMRGIRLIISGTLKADGRLQSQPGTLKCGSIKKPQHITRRLRIARRDGTPVRFRTARSSSPAITVMKLDESDEAIILAVEADSALMKPGPFAGTIAIETEGEANTHIDVDVEAKVVGYIAATPSSLFFGRVPAGSHGEWRIALRTGKPLASLRASHSLGVGFSVAVDGMNGIVVGHDGQHSGVVNGEVRICAEYSDGYLEEIVVPAIGVVFSATSSGNATEPQIGPVRIDVSSDVLDKDGSMSLAAMATDLTTYYFNGPVARGKEITINVPESTALLSLSWMAKTSSGRTMRPKLLRVLTAGSAKEVHLKMPAGTARCQLLFEHTAPASVAEPAEGARLAHVYRVALIQDLDSQAASIYMLQEPQEGGALRKDILEDLRAGEYETVMIAEDADSGSIMAQHGRVVLASNEMTTLTIPSVISPMAVVKGRISYNGKGRAVAFLRKADSEPIAWSVIVDIGVADALGVDQPDRTGDYVLMVPTPGTYVVTACIMNSGRELYGVPVVQESKTCVAEKGRTVLVDFDFEVAASSQATTRSVKGERDNH